MIESLKLKNFRGFRELSLTGLRRFNFIVGENGSGKTALLEALFMAGGRSPEIYIRTRAWRSGKREVKLTAAADALEVLLREAFFRFDVESPIQIEFVDREKGIRSLRVFMGPRTVVTLPLETKPAASSALREAVFTWNSPEGSVESSLKVVGDELQVGPVANPYPIIFLNNLTLASEQNAERFSELSQKNREKPLVDVVKSVYPLIQDLSIQIDTGSPSVFASVRGLREKMPVAFVSAGINKFIAILLAVAVQSKGAVLIDEIENGLYYDCFDQVWSGIAKIAMQEGSQVFVSTHSLEFLRVVHSFLTGNEKDYCLIRTERVNGQCTATVFSGRQFETAIEQNVDVR